MNDHDDALQPRATEATVPAPEPPDIVDAPRGRVSEEESGWKPLLPERKLGIWWALLTFVVAVGCGTLVSLWAGHLWLRFCATPSFGFEFLMFQLLFTAAGCLVTVGMLKLRGLSVTVSLALSGFRFSDLRKALLLLIVLMVLELLVYEGFGLESGADGYIEALWRRRGSWVFVFIGMCICPAVVEELLCRGVLFSGIRNSVRSERWSAFLAIACPAVVFGILHLQYNWYTMVLCMVYGVVFGIAREATGSLYPPMILHAGSNTISLILLAISEG